MHCSRLLWGDLISPLHLISRLAFFLPFFHPFFAALSLFTCPYLFAALSLFVSLHLNIHMCQFYVLSDAEKGQRRIAPANANRALVALLHPAHQHIAALSCPELCELQLCASEQKPARVSV
jgi:hypothetical protein